MPAGLGGTYDSAQTMFRQCWIRVFELVDGRPVPAEYLPVGPGRVVVPGRCQGTPRSTGREFSAAFAHVLRITNSQVSELVQITDTARWHEALAP